jgi:hypothetical protein
MRSPLVLTANLAAAWLYLKIVKIAIVVPSVFVLGNLAIYRLGTKYS